MALTFAPDGPRSGPGLLLDVNNMVGLPNGNYRTASSAGGQVTSSNLPGKCLGMAAPMVVDGTYRFFWGVNDAHSSATKSRLYRASTFGGAVTDVSKSGDYTVDTRWRFVNWGNLIIAVNNADAPQAYTDGTSTDFADLSANAPTKAALVEAVNDWIFMADYQVTGGGATYRDGWITSDQSDPTNWNGGSANLQFSGRILDTGGPITAIRKFNNDCVMFKRGSVYLLSFVDEVLGWYKVHVGIGTGTLTNECVVSANGMLYYVDGVNRDFYVFDGTRPRSLTGGNARGLWSRFFLQDSVRAIWSIDEMAPSIFGVHDAVNKNIIWFYDSGDGTEDLSGYSKAWVSYNYVSGKWGAGNHALQMDFAISDNYLPATTIGYLTNYPGMYALMTYYNSTHRVSYGFSGSTLPMSFKTAFVGDNDRSVLWTGVRPVFAAPLDSDVAASENQIPTGTMTLRYTNTPMHGVNTSLSTNTGFSWNTTERFFNGGQQARWASAEITLTGTQGGLANKYWEIEGVEFLLQGTGKL